MWILSPSRVHLLVTLQGALPTLPDHIAGHLTLVSVSVWCGAMLGQGQGSLCPRCTQYPLLPVERRISLARQPCFVDIVHSGRVPAGFGCPTRLVLTDLDRVMSSLPVGLVRAPGVQEVNGPSQVPGWEGAESVARGHSYNF